MDLMTRHSTISYAEREIFKPEELVLWRRATKLVAFIPEAFTEIRCHELARAVGIVLGLKHQDGFYGFVDHTWLWTRPLESRRTVGRIGFPHVLDVYSVGSMPMVRLVDGEHTALPHIGWAYRPGAERDDINTETVVALAEIFFRNEREYPP